METATLQNRRLTYQGNIRQSRHGWLRLTPAYSVHLVEELLAQISGDDTVLEPFCGTGTTPLVCATLGSHCQAVDINPFLVWLARTKTHSFTPAEIADCKRISAVVSDPDSGGVDPWVPPISDVDRWWDAPVLTQLSELHARLSMMASSVAPAAYDLACVSLCRTVIKTANVSFGHQSMSFRHRSAEPTLFTDDNTTIDLFKSELMQLITESQRLVPLCSASIIEGDSRYLDALPIEGGYSMVVTSPPYPNRMSYIRELRPYMYWLGHLQNGRQAGELDWAAMGGTWGCATSNLTKWLPEPGAVVPYDGFEEMLMAISSRSRVLSTYVEKYFHDAVQHINSMLKVLRPGAMCYYVVGNSKFYEVVVPTQEIYAAIFRAVGFERVSTRAIRKRSSKKELFEYVVEAQAP